jgi:hypothetical protein
MTPRVKGIGTINKDVHQKTNSKLEYNLWKNVIKDCLLEATTEILEKQRGYDLPIELGKIIILQAATIVRTTHLIFCFKCIFSAC